MIYLFTGAPGSFKSYSAIVFARELAADNRPVYVHGVSEINVPGWQVISADDVRAWEEVLPVGAVLLCDEVASLVPQRQKGEPPKWIDSLRTHRHRGLDLIFVTQHPMDVDVVFRRLVGEHRHYFRQFGRRQVSYIRGDQVDENPDMAKLKPGQVIEKRGVDKTIFKLYRSTQLDTHRLRVPRKIVYAALFLIGAIIGSYLLVNNFADRRDRPTTIAKREKSEPAVIQGPYGDERPQCLAWAQREGCR